MALGCSIVGAVDPAEVLRLTEKLFEAGVVSKQQLDNAQTAHDSAVAQLKALGEQVNQQSVELRYYRVAAPMAGIITPCCPFAG